MVRARRFSRLIDLLRITAIVAIAAVVVACTGKTMGPGSTDGRVPHCDDVPPIETAAELYRKELVYVSEELHPGAVLRWARSKPAFEGMWLDIKHNRWVTLAFSRDAAARQAEVEEAFPGEGVVAVEVDWTMAELEALQEKVIKQGHPFVRGAGALVNYGVVSISVDELTEETVAAIDSRFGGLRVCVEEGVPVSDSLDF